MTHGTGNGKRVRTYTDQTGRRELTHRQARRTRHKANRAEHTDIRNSVNYRLYMLP